MPRLRSRLDLPVAITEGLAAVNNAQFIIQVCKGIIRSQRVRRTLMFWDVLVVLVLIFVGSTFLWPWLRQHPLLFLAYWVGLDIIRMNMVNSLFTCKVIAVF